MARIPEDVANNIFQKLVDRVIDEAYYLCCFKKIAKDFEEEKEKLKPKLSDVKRDIDESTNAVKDIDEVVTQWQKTAMDLIAEDTKTNKSWFLGWCRNCIWQYQRGKDLAEKIPKIKELIGKDFSKIGRYAKLPSIEYHSTPNFMPFDSRKLKYDALLEELRKDETYIIALQGLGGSGKTTLAIKVGEIVKQEKLFDRAIIITVSNNPDMKTIQDQIAMPLGVVFKEEESNLDRAKRLWLRLTNGERILIVLDDVWKKLKFEDIGIPFAHNHKGCCILITTRDQSVCHIMGCHSPIIQLDILSEDEAWSFFQMRSDINVNPSKKLKETAEKIAKECKGLPLALDVVASTLKGRPLEVWKAALRSLEDPRPVDIAKNELREVYRSLKLSYDFLDNDYAQKLFILCSLFPEDYEIPLEDLTVFAIGLGLFGEIDSYKRARDDMCRAKNRLLEVCLLMEVEKRECVKMHDLIRDVAKEIANNQIHLIVGPEWNLGNIEQQRDVRYLYCQNMIDFLEQLPCPNLKILIASTNNKNFLEVPETSFEEMVSLKVLAVMSSHWWIYDWDFQDRIGFKMPRSTEMLKSLRTLHLKGFELEDISILSKLQGLETLELIYCIIKEFPNGIMELDKLRLLKLEGCNIERNPLGIIGKLSKIEELYFVGNFGSSWEFTHELIVGLFDKDGISQKLQRYCISLENPRQFSNCLKIAKSVSKGVGIEQCLTDSISNETINSMIQGAEYLALKNIERGYRSVFPTLIDAIGGDMNELTQLVIISYYGMECLVDTAGLPTSIETIFSNLIKLQLEEIHDLEELCKGCQITPNIFGKLQWLCVRKCSKLHGNLLVRNLNLGRLEELNLSNCSKLISVCTFSTAQSLVKLSQLEIEECNELKHIVTEDRVEGEEIVQDQNEDQLLFPVLIEMRLVRLPNLISISSERLSPENYPKTRLHDSTITLGQHFSNSKYLGSAQCLLKESFALSRVKYLCLDGCPKLMSLLTLSVASTIMLETLRIRNCHGMKQIITNEGDYQNPNNKTIFPKLERVDVYNCNILEFIFPASSSGKLLCLKSISIKETPELKYVFGQYHHEVNSSHLNNNLEIQIDLPALEDLYLINLPKIINICPNMFYATWPPLRYFSLRNCPLLGVTSVCDFMAHYDTRQRNKITRKDSKEILKHFQHLKYLTVSEHPQIEGILHLEELHNNLQHATTDLYGLSLFMLSELRYIFTGPKYFLSLQNLGEIHIRGCEKLKVVFSTSILRSLPQLWHLRIQDCNILEQLIKEDNENQNLSISQSQVMCLPKLAAIIVSNCPKLKHLFRCYEYPKLQVLLIKGASELVEALGWEQCEITDSQVPVVLPKLKYLILEELQSIATFSEVINVPYCLVHDCPNLNIPSTTTHKDLLQSEHAVETDVAHYSLWYLLEDIFSDDDFKYKENSNEVEAVLETEPRSESQRIKEAETVGQWTKEDCKLEEDVAAITSTDSKSGNPLIEPSVKTMEASPQDLAKKESMNKTSSKDQQEHGEIRFQVHSDMDLAHVESRKYPSMSEQEAISNTHSNEPQNNNDKMVIKNSQNDILQSSSNSEKPTAIATSSASFPSHSPILLQDTTSLELVMEQSRSDPSQSQQPLGEVKVTTEVPHRANNVVQELSSIAESKETHAERTDTKIQERRASQGLSAEELNQIEEDMKAFYASFENECSAMPLPESTSTEMESVNVRASEETQKALEILRELLSKKFTLLLHPARSGLMNNVLDYLLSLSPEDGISSTMKSVMEELLRSFRKWSLEYGDANLKHESATANRSKMEKLEEGLEANIKEFREVAKLENGICSHLAYLEARKREFEAEIADYKSAGDRVAERKRQVFEDGKMLKAEKEDLCKRIPQLREEQEWAKKTKVSIECEWSKLRQQFMESSGFGE